MKITRKNLRLIIKESFKDLTSTLANREAGEGTRRIIRPKGAPAPKRRYLDYDEPLEPVLGQPEIVTAISDARFDDRKAKNLYSDSAFVAGSPNYHATYQNSYSDEELTFLLKKKDPITGKTRYMPIKGDYPDHEVGSYVIVPELFGLGLLGVSQIVSSSNLEAVTVDGKVVTVPVITLKTIKTGRMVSKVGKAFVKKVAGSRSLEKAYELEEKFKPRLDAYRE
jgi:hypothetical protein